MKKIVALILALLMLLPVLGAFGENESIYLALGDSITTGFGLKEGENSFPEIVAEISGYTLINRAVNGNTASGILQQMTIPKVLSDIQRADVITITCGGNDLLGMLYEYVIRIHNANAAEEMQIAPSDILLVLSNPADARYQVVMQSALNALSGNEELNITSFTESIDIQVAMTEFMTNMGIILTGIKAQNPDAQIIVATQYNPYKSFSGFYQGMNEAMQTGAQLLSSSIITYSTLLNYQVAEVYAAFESSEENLSNADMTTMNMDFHPNANGHRVIAECVLKALAPMEE